MAKLTIKNSTKSNEEIEELYLKDAKEKDVTDYVIIPHPRKQEILNSLIEYRNKNGIKCSIHLDNDNSGLLINDSTNELIFGFYNDSELIEFFNACA